MVTVLERGERLDSSPALFSVASFNLLAPLYVRPIDERTGEVQGFAAFPWAEPADKVLAWDVRAPKLLQALSECAADVICLQEVQFEAADDGHSFRLPRWMDPLIGSGYEAILPDQKELTEMADRNLRVLRTREPVGNAVIFRSSRVALQAEQRAKQGTTMVCGAFVGAEQSPLREMQTVTVICVHLDATSEGKRVSQLKKCLSVIREAGRNAVVVGDMNSDLADGTCVSAFVGSTASEEQLIQECRNALREGSDGAAAEMCVGPEGGQDPAMDALKMALKNNFPQLSDKQAGGKKNSTSTQEHPEIAKCSTTDELLNVAYEQWRALRQDATASSSEQRVLLSQAPSGPTRSGWEHGASAPPCVAWRLDHVLFTPRGLKLVARWSTLAGGDDAENGDRKGVETGLPNEDWPSDHVPVAAAFAMIATPVLDAEASRGLVARIADLGSKHQVELAAIVELAAAAVLELEAKLGLGAAEQVGKPAKKKSKGKPPAEVMALRREQRIAQKELEAAQRAERAELIEELGEVERDLVESRLVGSIREWQEQGAQKGKGLKTDK